MSQGQVSGQEAKDHDVPPPDAGASDLCPAGVGAVRAHWTNAGPGEAGHVPSLGGEVSPAVTPSSARHPSGPCLSGGPNDLIRIIRQPPDPASRIAGRTTWPHP